MLVGTLNNDFDNTLIVGTTTRVFSRTFEKKTFGQKRIVFFIGTMYVLLSRYVYDLNKYVVEI